MTQMLKMFTEFIVEFAHFMLGADTPSSWGLFIYREQFDPSEAFEILHTQIFAADGAGIRICLAG